MKFWLPLIILLAAISPNLEAETIDPRGALTAQPYLLEITVLNNVDFNRLKFTADVTIDDYDPVNDIIEGELNWEINGVPWLSRGFRGRLTEEGKYTSVKIFPYIGTIWRGEFSDDFLSASGRFDGVGTSDMEGSWTLTAVDLPSSGVLFIGACGALMVMYRRRSTK